MVISVFTSNALYISQKFGVKENVQVCVMSLNGNLHCVRGKDTSTGNGHYACMCLTPWHCHGITMVMQFGAHAKSDHFDVE